jgi:hypothetical protein
MLAFRLILWEQIDLYKNKLKNNTNLYNKYTLLCYFFNNPFKTSMLTVWHIICFVLSLWRTIRRVLILAEISIEFQDSAII